MKTVLLADAKPQPWRNGGGVTHELLAWPDAAAWQLRVSVATIAQNGPFSAFPGVQRWFAVLQGAGVVLGLDGVQHRLQPGSAPLRFDGAAAPTCHLLDGHTQDLNLMLRHDAGTGGMQPAIAALPWHSAAPFRALFCTGAAVLMVQDQPATLPGAGLLFSAQAAGQAWCLHDLAEGARAWWLHFQPRAS